MQQTTNYNLLIPEGTDVVNPLTQVNPNFQTIDGAMFANKQATVGTASEVVTGTVHAIVRSNTDSNVFRFTATGAWTAGDSMTVDGVGVTVHLSDGTTPATGAYIIGAEVVAVVNGSLVTLLTSAAQPVAGVTSFNSRTGAVVPAASDYDGSMIDYDNTTSGLNSTDVQGAIDELAGSSVNISWTLAGREIGTTPVTLPGDFTEILILFNYSATSSRATAIIPKSAITSGYITDIYQTTVGSSNVVGTIYATITASAVTLGTFSVGGGDVTASAYTTVYYR